MHLKNAQTYFSGTITDTNQDFLARSSHLQVYAAGSQEELWPYLF